MIKLNDFQIFSKYYTTLKETSIDISKMNEGLISYMTESEIEAVNFDSVKNEYIKDLKLVETPTSNDALISDASGKLYFIEFKNGEMSRQKEFNVRKKIFDSIFIFTDIVGKGISYTREYIDYVLVYNETKNDKNIANANSHVQNSTSRDFIFKKVASYGNTNHINFGLEMFKGYCFNNVYTLTEKEFEDFLISKFW